MKPRKPGRPKMHTEPRTPITLQVPTALLEAIDAVAENRTAFFEAAAREKLERAAAVPRRSGRPKRDATAGSE